MITVAAAIPTYGRVDGVERAIRSVLLDPDLSALFIIDQNQDDSLTAIVATIDDRRIRHVRTDRKGAGHARNLALDLTDADVLCCLDDDCEAGPRWASMLAATIMQSDDVGLAFSTVEQTNEPGQREGFTPARTFTRDTKYRQWRWQPTTGQLGIGASYGLRVAAARDIGGWDDEFGPGGTFPSADDFDIAYRMLHFGWAIRCLPQPTVVHHGHRTAGRQLRQLVKRDYLATGAMYGKLFKVAPLRTTRSVLWFAATTLFYSLQASFLLRRPGGLGRLLWPAVGAFRALALPVDVRTARFHAGVDRIPRFLASGVRRVASSSSVSIDSGADLLDLTAINSPREVRARRADSSAT